MKQSMSGRMVVAMDILITINQTNKQKHEYMTFKYSSRFRGTLHEAILLNGKPVFLKYENGQVQVVPKSKRRIGC